MRLQEFADAEEQIKLWKLISDSVWNTIRLQTIEQEKRLAASQRKQLKKKSAAKPSKKPKIVSTPKLSAPPVASKQKPIKTEKSAIAKNKQTDQPQTQKPQVLPKVFSNTAKSNLVQPQTPVTSAASLSPQNAAMTRSDRLLAPDSVASAQRQLYPLANSDVVKRMTQ
jgi:predicted lipid-binding transport protein (Tim44 family)